MIQNFESGLLGNWYWEETGSKARFPEVGSPSMKSLTISGSPFARTINSLIDAGKDGSSIPELTRRTGLTEEEVLSYIDRLVIGRVVISHRAQTQSRYSLKYNLLE